MGMLLQILCEDTILCFVCIQELFSARVCDIMNESDSVKRLRLEVPHPDFNFRAGQW